MAEDDLNAGGAGNTGGTPAPDANAGGSTPPAGDNGSQTGSGDPGAQPGTGAQPNGAGDTKPAPEVPPAGDKGAPPAGEDGTQKPAFKIPDEYKDKPWAAKIHSEEDLYKQIETLTALKGKKIVVPDLAQATEQEREEYFALTRPKSADEYQFKEDTDPMMKEAVSKLLFDKGIGAYQANEIIKGYEQAEQALLDVQFDPEGYKEVLKTAFGNEWEGVTKQIRTSLTNMMGKDDAAMLDHLPNVYLGLVYRTLGNVVKAYGIKETDGAHLTNNDGHAKADLTSRLKANTDALNSLSRRSHTAAEKQALIVERDKLFKEKLAAQANK